MSEKSATVTLRYRLDNSQALDALKAIEAEHDRIARKIGQPISMGGVSGGGSSGGGSTGGGSPYIPSWANPGLARFAVGGSSGVGASMAQRMSGGYVPPGSFSGPSPSSSSASLPVANFQNSLFRQMLTHLKSIDNNINRAWTSTKSPMPATMSDSTWNSLGKDHRREISNMLSVHEESQRGGGGSGGRRDRHGDGAGDGAHPSGMSNALVRQLTRMAVAYAVYHVISDMPRATTNAVNTSQRADLTQSQKSRQAAEHLPIIGSVIGSILRFKDAIDGTTERIRAAIERMRYDTIENQTQATYMATSAQLHFQRAGAQGRASALGALTPRLTDRSFDRSTFHGQVGYDESESRRHAQSSLDVALAQGEGSRAEVANASSSLSNIDAQINSVRAARDAALARVAQTGQNPPAQPGTAIQGAAGVLGPAGAGIGGFLGRGINQLASGQGGIFGNIAAAPFMAPQAIASAGQSQGPRVQALTEAIRLGEQLENLETERISRLNRMSAAMRAQGASEQQIGQARIQVLQAEMQMLQQREQRMSHGAQSLGMMNPVDRGIAMNAFREYQRVGWDNMPVFMREQMAQVATNTARSAAIRSGENSDEFRELQAAGEFGHQPGSPQQSIADVRQAISTLADRMSTTQLQTLQTSANLELGGIRLVLNSILVAIMARGGVQMNRALFQNQLQNAQGQGG